MYVSYIYSLGFSFAVNCIDIYDITLYSSKMYVVLCVKRLCCLRSRCARWGTATWCPRLGRASSSRPSARCWVSPSSRCLPWDHLYSLLHIYIHTITVGYDNMVPYTWQGKFIAFFCALLGISFFVLPAVRPLTLSLTYIPYNQIQTALPYHSVLPTVFFFCKSFMYVKK